MAPPTWSICPNPPWICKPGVIVQAQVRPGDHRDSEDLSARVIEAVANVQVAQGLTDPEALPETLTADKGYFSLEELGAAAQA